MIHDIEGGITAPKGFRASGVACGIKRRNPSLPAAPLDLALIVADAPAAAAAVFTTNKAVAAPVVVSREHLARSGGLASAVVVNSGCANACTGEAGLTVARQMADAAAQDGRLRGPTRCSCPRRASSACCWTSRRSAPASPRPGAT